MLNSLILDISAPENILYKVTIKVVIFIIFLSWQVNQISALLSQSYFNCKLLKHYKMCFFKNNMLVYLEKNHVVYYIC